jgi:hypothetical protein
VKDDIVDGDSTVRAGACLIPQEIIQVRAARMRNTLLPIKAEYLSITGVHGLQMSYGRWRVSSAVDLVEELL